MGIKKQAKLAAVLAAPGCYDATVITRQATTACFLHVPVTDKPLQLYGMCGINHSAYSSSTANITTATTVLRPSYMSTYAIQQPN